jgi:hypothetical protein
MTSLGSDSKSDGLLTSGSWLYEATYKFPETSQWDTQSLVRFYATGSSGESLLFNLVANRNNNNESNSVSLKLHSSVDPAVTNQFSILIDSCSLFDGDRWHVSFGRNKISNFESMFAFCSSLESIPLLNTANGLTFGLMFSNCTSLETIPLLDLSKSFIIQTMFNNCTALQTIPVLDFGNPFYASQPFAGCTNLKQAATKAPLFSPWSVNDLNLSPAAINQVFTNLPNVSGSRICNIINNWGVSGCNRSIATLKGWTIAPAG